MLPSSLLNGLNLQPHDLAIVLVVGGLVGLIIGRILRGGFGFFIDILIGLLGSYLASVILTSYIAPTAGTTEALIVAGAGAFILTTFLRLFRHGSSQRAGRADAPGTQTAQSTQSVQSVQPTRSTSKRPVSFSHWTLHIRRTLRLLGALLRDPHVSFFRKALFMLTTIVFGVILFIPDSIIVAFLATVLPIASPLLGIPAGIIDIAALSAAMYLLLDFFPRDIVNQHAVQLYGPRPDIRPHVHVKA